MKNRIIIKQAKHRGQDNRIFRAYDSGKLGNEIGKPLGVQAATTGNRDMGAKRCAAKAFQKLGEPGDPYEVEGRITLSNLNDSKGIWMATLHPEVKRGISAERTRVCNWIPVDASMPDADMTVIVYSPDSTEQIWLGYHDGECWRDVDASQYEHPVTHWMNFPEPPEVKP